MLGQNNASSTAGEAFDDHDDVVIDELHAFDDEDSDDVVEEILCGGAIDEDVAVELRLKVGRGSRDREGRRRRPRRRRLVPVHTEEPGDRSPPDDTRIERFRTLCGLDRLSSTEVGELLQLCRDVGRYLADEDVVAYAAKRSEHRRHGAAWTDEEKEAVVRLVRDGVTLDAISEQLCRSKGAIRSAARRLLDEGRLGEEDADWLHRPATTKPR